MTILTQQKQHPSEATLVTPEEALSLVLAAASPLSTKRMPLADVCGLILAEPVTADRDYPPADRAMMDGYAVRLSAAGRTLPVVGQLAAGSEPSLAVAEGTCIEIMTGAACPPGAEAVIQKEAVSRSADQATFPNQISTGQHIAPQGSECRVGRCVLEAGELITPLSVAVLASFGIGRVLAVPRPRLAIIITGNELIAPGTSPAAWQIRDSNGPMLRAFAMALELQPPLLLSAADDLHGIVECLGRTSDCDLVVFAGGVSVGKYDLVPDALRRLGAEIVLHKVRQKPGKPLLVARRANQLIFGLPGNPLACHFCFHRYVAAAIRQMSGRGGTARPEKGRLTEAVETRPGRTHFIPALANRTAAGEHFEVCPLPGVSSADVFNTRRATCYVTLPPDRQELPAGAEVEFEWIGGIG